MKKGNDIKLIKNNKQRGVTLIALVVTIVILIILSVVTINTLSNSNIIKMSKFAKNEMELSTIREAIQVYYLDNELAKKEGNPVGEQFKKEKIKDEKTLEAIRKYQSNVENAEQIHFDRLYELDMGKIGLEKTKNEYIMDIETRMIYINNGIETSRGMVYIIEEREIFAVILTANESDNGFKLIANADEENTQVESYSFYINGELYKTIETDKNTAEIEVTDKEFGTYECYVIVNNYNGQHDRSVEISAENYCIKTAEDMKLFRDSVNNGNTFSGKKVKVLNDIDLGGSESNRNWIAIGNVEKVFEGTFEGNNYEIRNIYNKEKTGNYQGLFGYLNNATIRNVKVVSGNIQGNMYCGAIAGQGTNTNIENCRNVISVQITNGFNGGIIGLSLSGNIVNCSNSGRIENTGVCGDYGESLTGGIVGHGSKTLINKCSNTGEVIGQGIYVGGIAGVSENQILNSNNEGNITSKKANIYSDSHVGGIVGNMADNYNIGVKIEKCINDGDVYGNGKYVGGIIGASNNGNIKDCENKADVFSEIGLIGGIVGGTGVNVEGTINLSIQNCSNSGRVETIGIVGENGESFVGGIVGHGEENIINECNNRGEVIGQGIFVGGIAGVSENQILNSYNEGNITSKQANEYGQSLIGGIAGILSDNYNLGAKIENCYNIGKINGKGNEVGGITGSVTGGTIKQCYNTGYICSDTGLIGGISGILYKHGTTGVEVVVENCYNEGTIEAKGVANTDQNSIAGGIAGGNNGTISKSWNSGKVIAKNSEVGGIVGFNTKEILNCYNIGTVEAKEKNSSNSCWIGGIVGNAHSTSVINYCYNRGDLIASYNYIGGIVGLCGVGATTSNCYNTFNITKDATLYKDQLVGNYDAANISNCYYMGTITSGQERAEADMKTTAFIELIGGSSIWKLDTNNKNKGFVILQWE